MRNAIDIKGVSKTYRDFTLDSLTLSLPEGSIMGLIGENGAGKSTTIKLIMNAILPDSGSIEVYWAWTIKAPSLPRPRRT